MSDGVMSIEIVQHLTLDVSWINFIYLRFYIRQCTFLVSLMRHLILCKVLELKLVLHGADSSVFIRIPKLHQLS